MITVIVTVVAVLWTLIGLPVAWLIGNAAKMRDQVAADTRAAQEADMQWAEVGA